MVTELLQFTRCSSRRPQKEHGLNSCRMCQPGNRSPDGLCRLASSGRRDPGAGGLIATQLDKHRPVQLLGVTDGEANLSGFASLRGDAAN